jgi:hypothetical protein
MSTDVMTPGRTGQADRPSHAGRPAHPVRPARPARRASPGQQVPAGRPARPAGPDRLARPARPAGPEGLAEPARAAGPDRLARPGRPGQPVKPGRPGRSARPGRPLRQEPARPARLARPSAQPGPPARPRDEPGQPARRTRDASHAQGAHLGRTSFVVLVLGLLGGGLVCLLVVNTTLAANSIEITNLRQSNAAKTERVQQFRQEVTAERSASVIEREAWRLGMRPDAALNFLDLRTRSIRTGSDPGAGLPGSGGAATEPVKTSHATAKPAAPGTNGPAANRATGGRR